MGTDGAAPPILRIGACIGGNLLLRAGSSGTAAVVSLYLASLGSSRATFVGLLALAFYSAELLGSPLFGLLSDRAGGRRFMILGCVLAAAAAVAMTLPFGLSLFVIGKAAQGLSTASTVPSVLSFLARNTGESESFRGRVMIAFEVATVVGIAIGFALGGFLWDQFRISALYGILVPYALAILAFAFVGDGASTGRQPAQWRVYGSMVRHGAVIAFAPAWIAVNAVLGMWLTHLGFQMAKTDDPSQLLVGGFNGLTIGLVSAGIALLFIIGASVFALAFGRMSTARIMSWALVALALFCLLMYALNHTPETAPVRISLLISGVSITLLVVSGFTPAALTFLAQISEHFPQNRGALMGLYSVFLGIGQLLGGWVGGFFAQAWGVDGLILATALLGLVANAFLLMIARPAVPEPEHPESAVAA